MFLDVSFCGFVGVVSHVNRVPPRRMRMVPRLFVMFSLVMLCSTPAGDAYTFGELESMFRHAGFTRSELRVPSPAGPQVIISQR